MQMRSGHAGLGFVLQMPSLRALMRYTWGHRQTCSGKCEESNPLRIERGNYIHTIQLPSAIPTALKATDTHTHTHKLQLHVNRFMEQQASRPTEETVREPRRLKRKGQLLKMLPARKARDAIRGYG